MYKHCDKCKKNYDKSSNNCHICGKPLEMRYDDNPADAQKASEEAVVAALLKKK